MDRLKRLFEQHFRIPVENVRAMQGELGGSGRRLFRLGGGTMSAIGVLYDVREENVAFLEFSRHFRKHGLPVPEIYAADLDHGAYLEEDLGDVTLFGFLSQHRSGEIIEPEVFEAYRRTILTLPRFQIEAGRDLNYRVCYPRGHFDRQSMRWDLNYFKYSFLRLAGVPFSEQALEDDFSRLTSFLLGARRNFFLYRDYQSRNVMLRQGQPYFLDYQGGRKGALQYDVASLLYDAKADLPPEFRQRLLDEYLDALPNFVDCPRDAFMEYYYAFVYIRLMQALGAYGFRGFYERKPHFLKSVPYAVKNLRWLLHHAALPIELPALLDVFHGILASTRLQHLDAEANGVPDTRGSREWRGENPLRVTIFSFSYRRGVPQDGDESGNGGGFVFDCRSLPNPGREAYFQALNGKDEAVMAYLDRQESVHQFLAAVMSLVDASVSSYRQRGFRNLMVSFGCTGGQHRSVYLAERLAQHLRSRDGVEVVVRHRELEDMGAQGAGAKLGGEAAHSGSGR